jgi:hypothetical protein
MMKDCKFPTKIAVIAGDRGRVGAISLVRRFRRAVLLPKKAARHQILKRKLSFLGDFVMISAL